MSEKGRYKEIEFKTGQKKGSKKSCLRLCSYFRTQVGHVLENNIFSPAIWKGFREPDRSSPVRCFPKSSIAHQNYWKGRSLQNQNTGTSKDPAWTDICAWNQIREVIIETRNRKISKISTKRSVICVCKLLLHRGDFQWWQNKFAEVPLAGNVRDLSSSDAAMVIYLFNGWAGEESRSKQFKILNICNFKFQ